MLEKPIARALVLCFLFALIPLTEAAPRLTNLREREAGSQESLTCRVVGLLNLSLIRKRILRCPEPVDRPVTPNPTNSINTITDNPDPSLADQKDGDEDDHTEEEEPITPLGG